VGEGQGEGYATELNLPSIRGRTTAVSSFATAQGLKLSACSPLSLSLPHKGGGNHVARAFVTDGPVRGIV